METSVIAYQEKVEKPTIGRKIDAISCLGLSRPNTGTLSGQGFNNKQCSLQWDAYWQAEAWNPKQTPRTTVESIVLLHDNVRPQIVAHTVETLQKLNFKVLAHPPYSPDLAPSDYHQFGPLKEALRGRRFTSDQELKNAVHEWLGAQPKTLFSEGIKKLVQLWKKCIEKQGDCVEKWYYKFSIFIEIKLV